MTALFCGVISVAFLLLAVRLSRGTRPCANGEDPADNMLLRGIEHRPWLHLSERIFDPSDIRWLEQELGLPILAGELIAARKQLAIYWLEALRFSFDEFVRTPQYSFSDESEVPSTGGWQMLWFTARFKISITYALLMVKWFGPYHRLIPSFSWLPFSQKTERSFRRPAFANSRSAH